MSVFDILACPTCRVPVSRDPDGLHCGNCGQKYPVLNGVPIMLPDGSVPEILHQAEFERRDTYEPWVDRTILQSLPDDRVVLELGGGSTTVDDPCVVRVDSVLTPFVDVVVDHHALPFLAKSVDYVFSHGVLETLANPFSAAESMWEVLVDGGYVYAECDFVGARSAHDGSHFAPTKRGLAQILAAFTPLRSGVAPHQMPSFAIASVLRGYLAASSASVHDHGTQLTDRLQELLELPLVDFDIYFDEVSAATVAAGTFFTGVKRDSPDASVIPGILHGLHESDGALRERFPDVNDLSEPDNILWWALTEGSDTSPLVADWLASIEPWSKWDDGRDFSRAVVRGFEMESTPFGTLGLGSSERPLDELIAAVVAKGESAAASADALDGLSRRERRRRLRRSTDRQSDPAEET
ncbi:MAG: methyltransferase domain-containing protein [Acidimicrobiales bacterium]